MEDVVIIGAGAAGCFAAAILGNLCPSLRIVLLEKTRQPLAKVKISGGGRCNVTHHCFDVKALIENYPRGKDFLRSCFMQFQPRDMIQWLEEKGVSLKVESDGRMFPVTNRSQTIIDCLLTCLQKQGASLLLEQEVVEMQYKEGKWYVKTRGGTSLESHAVLVSTGGSGKMLDLLAQMGIPLEPSLPSLFTFTCKEEWLHMLSGSTVPQAIISLHGTRFSYQGPLLITHWGLSGPAILKLSAFAAKELAQMHYHATILVNWTGEKESTVQDKLLEAKKQQGSKPVMTTPLFSLSKNLWRAIVFQAHLPEEKNWSQVSSRELQDLKETLIRSHFTMVGKSTNKEEFVTCGGVSLQEISQKTMESKRFPGLYFAGEVVDIDGITGGFNFQNAWTGAFVAAQGIARQLQGYT
ncbi:MAG: NAD(P)/FAD-dependent oxidoreductase [Chlamydiae bacterium]|nr:NAD(P)/FAD-dependent oxidoreductase [Chlamydiota bacterium]